MNPYLDQARQQMAEQNRNAAESQAKQRLQMVAWAGIVIVVLFMMFGVYWVWNSFDSAHVARYAITESAIRQLDLGTVAAQMTDLTWQNCLSKEELLAIASEPGVSLDYSTNLFDSEGTFKRDGLAYKKIRWEIRKDPMNPQRNDGYRKDRAEYINWVITRENGTPVSVTFRFFEHRPVGDGQRVTFCHRISISDPERGMVLELSRATPGATLACDESPLQTLSTDEVQITR